MPNRFAIVFLVLLAGVICAYSIPIDDTKGDFLVDQWTTDNGLPQNTVTSIAQTRDGYLWIGTFGGLARFDGISFTIFDAVSTPALRSNRILSLFEDSHGTLWIGTETGEVFFLKDRHFRELVVSNELTRTTVWGFEEDRNGTLFVACDSGLEKVTLDDAGETVPGSHSVISTRRSSRLAKDPSGRIWAKVGDDIFLIENEGLVPAKQMQMPFPEGTQRIAFLPDGRAFVGATGTLGIASADGYDEFLRLFYKVHRSGLSVSVYGDSLWFQQAGELYEFKDGRGKRYDLSKYVEGGSRVLRFDNEGNLWIGTQYNGLVRLTRREIALVSSITGKYVEGVYSLAQDTQGAVWLAAGDQLLRVKGNDVQKIEGVDRGARFPVVRSLAVDANGVLWVGGTSGLYYLQGEVLVPVSSLAEKHIHALFFDRRQRLWIGSTDGVGVLEGNTYTHYTTADGLADNSVHYITQTRNGEIWIATFRGISVLEGEQFKNITIENGLSAGYVRDILEDMDGTMWIATYGGGITRIRNGSMTAIRRAEGLPNNFVSRIILDDNSRFWISTNVGILAVDRDVLNDVADGQSPILAGSKYDISDGMPSSEANGGHQPAGIRTSDGKLWFPMLKDVVILDPRPRDTTPPSIVIEDASARSVTDKENDAVSIFDPNSRFEIPDGLRNLEIKYTGISFRKPDEIRFFYKLEGLDDRWIDAGNRRTAFFPYLPAGDYTFLVRALSADGLWSPAPASVKIVVKQRFWETKWFLIILSLGLFGAAALLVYSRTRRQHEKKTQQAEFSRRLINAQEAERQRMAAELHDGLGQNLLLIKNWAQLGRSKKKDPKVLGEYLGKIEETASKSIEEAREIAQHLSPQILIRFGLTEAIMNIVDQIRDATEISIEAKIDDIDGLFNGEVELYIYRIVQECLNNLVRHSLSSSGKLDVRKLPESVTMVVQDFGKGFDVGTVVDRHEVIGFGLPSIAERVRLVGGELSIESVPDQGTRIKVELSLDAPQNQENKNSDRR